MNSSRCGNWSNGCNKENEKATVAGKTPKAEVGTTTATWAAKRIENAKSRTTKKTARIAAGTK